MSAGFMGVARARRSKVVGGREGEMEWVWSLFVGRLAFVASAMCI